MVCVCMHSMGVVVLDKVIKGSLSKEVAYKHRLEWREGVSHRNSKKISFQE